MKKLERSNCNQTQALVITVPDVAKFSKKGNYYMMSVNLLVCDSSVSKTKVRKNINIYSKTFKYLEIQKNIKKFKH